MTTTPIGEYAVIGDGRSAALIGPDAAIDWWTTPRFDSPALVARLLDEDAGRVTLDVPGGAVTERAWVPDTNVLRTRFETATGTLTVTDALLLDVPDGCAQVLLRSFTADGAAVDLRWRVALRPGFGATPEEVRSDGPTALVRGDGPTVRVCAEGGGEVAVDGPDLTGSATLGVGETATLALVSPALEGADPPAVGRATLLDALATTTEHWRTRAAQLRYPADAPWRDEVVRSALLIEGLCTDSGAIVAAATTSLPEQPGGSMNWDYRYMWLRDAALAADALLRLGLPDRTRQILEFLVHAGEGCSKGLQPFYRVDGSRHVPERELSDLSGWQGSRPVRVGNGAAGQEQLGNYGDLLQTAWLLARSGDWVDAATVAEITQMVDGLLERWQHPDSGIWELRDHPRHYTHSKIMCWVAFDRAVRLAEDGRLPDGSVARWRAARAAVREFVETMCWSPEHGAFVMWPGSDVLDAAVLMSLSQGFLPGDDPRVVSTIDAIGRELGAGPFVYRYTLSRGAEGAFLPCAFWLVDALHRAGRAAEARERMQGILAAAPALGAWSEEIEPATRELLGNVPQTLTLLALVNSAFSLAGARDTGGHRADDAREPVGG